MKIIAYNKDGKVKSVTEYADFVPNYVLTFDDTKSPLNITEEEIRVINSRKKSFEKSLTLFRLGLAIRNDFENYVKKVSLEDKHDTTPSFSDTGIVDKDEYLQINKVLTDILSLTYRRNRGYCEQLFESASEKLKGGKWFAGLYMRALKSAQNSKQNQRFNSTSLEKIEVKTFMKFLFLLHRYYYALRWCESLLPIELKRQLYIASVFANAPHDFEKAINLFKLEADTFIKKIANALFLLNEVSRSSIYFIIKNMLQICDKTANAYWSDNHIYEFSKQRKKTENEISELTLKSYGAENYTIKMSEAEFIALGIPLPQEDNKTREEILDDVKNCMEKIHEEYISNSEFTDSWVKELHTKIQSFRIKEHILKEDDFHLSDFYVYWMDEVANVYYPFLPQNCYKYVLLSLTEIGDKVSFSDDMILRLIQLLYTNRKNENDNQSGIYEARYKIDYMASKIIKVKVPEIIISNNNDNIKNKIFDFLDPILKSDNNFNLHKINANNFRKLLGNILCHYSFSKYLHKPSRFFNNISSKGDFNLTLVCKILGSLKDHNLIELSDSAMSRMLIKDEHNINVYGLTKSKIKPEALRRLFSKKKEEKSHFVSYYERIDMDKFIDAQVSGIIK